MESKKYKKNNLKERIFALSKKYLITGLVVIIPLWVTFFIVSIIFKWTSNLAFPIIDYFISDRYWVYVIARISSFFISIISIIIFGVFTNKVFGRVTLNFIESIVDKMPILRTVHFAAKQFMNFIFNKDEAEKFKKVIFVPYPTKNIYSVAFLTGEQTVNGKKHVCVFMPTTPNPTTGFLLLFKKEEIIYTEYTFEQAFQFIVSIGVINMDKNSDK